MTRRNVRAMAGYSPMMMPGMNPMGGLGVSTFGYNGSAGSSYGLGPL